MFLIFEVVVFSNIMEVYALKPKELSGWSLKSDASYVKTRHTSFQLVVSVFHILSKDIAVSESRIRTAVWSNLHHGSRAELKPEEPGPDPYSSLCHYLCWHSCSEISCL